MKIFSTMKNFICRVPKNVTAGCCLQGMLTVPKIDMARSVVQYRVIYTFNEWGRRQAKGLSCVTLAKKRDEASANTLQAMNGRRYWSFLKVMIVVGDGSTKFIFFRLLFE